MTKRPKRQPRFPDGLSGEMLNHLKYHLKNDGTFPPAPYQGLFWVETNTSQIDPWIAALEVIDGRNDKKAMALSTTNRLKYFATLVLPLQELLKSGRPLPPDARVYLADLFDRYQLKRKPGRKWQPAYKRTDIQLQMNLATSAVQRLVNSGNTVPKALELISKEYGIPLNTLENDFKGKRSSTRRFAKRRL